MSTDEIIRTNAAVRAVLQGLGAVESNLTESAQAGPLFHVWSDGTQTCTEVCAVQRCAPYTDPFDHIWIAPPAAWHTALAAQWPVVAGHTEAGMPCLWIGKEA